MTAQMRDTPQLSVTQLTEYLAKEVTPKLELQEWLNERVGATSKNKSAERLIREERDRVKVEAKVKSQLERRRMT